MPRKRFTPEQIIIHLREAEVLLSSASYVVAPLTIANDPRALITYQANNPCRQRADSCTVDRNL